MKHFDEIIVATQQPKSGGLINNDSMRYPQKSAAPSSIQVALSQALILATFVCEAPKKKVINYKYTQPSSLDADPAAVLKVSARILLYLLSLLLSLSTNSFFTPSPAYCLPALLVCSQLAIPRELVPPPPHTPVASLSDAHTSAALRRMFHPAALDSHTDCYIVHPLPRSSSGWETKRSYQ